MGIRGLIPPRTPTIIYHGIFICNRNFKHGCLPYLFKTLSNISINITQTHLLQWKDNTIEQKMLKTYSYIFDEIEHEYMKKVSMVHWQKLNGIQMLHFHQGNVGDYAERQPQG